MVIKHAFLIGAYKNPDYLLELIDSLDSERSSFYIHVNKFNDNDFSDFKNRIANRKNIHYYSSIKIRWGGSSLFFSQMLLLNEAFKDEDNQYFHFITGQDILCRPLDDFFRYVEKEKTNYLEYSPMPEKQKYRYECYSFFDILNLQKKGFLRAMNRLFIIAQEILHFKRSNLGYSEIYYGSGWWSLEREACQYVLSKWNNDNKLKRRMKNTCAPDEGLIQTILLNAKTPFPIVNDNLRYIKWEGKSSPRTLTLFDYDDIMKSGKFIARKVEPNESADLIRKIYEFVR